MRVLHPNEARHAVRLIERPKLEDALLALERVVLQDEARLRELVVRTVRKLAANDAACADTLLDGALASVAPKFPDAPIVLLVHPDQVERAKAGVARFSPRAGQRIRVEAQVDVARGGVVAVLPQTINGSTAIDAQLETRLELSLGQV